MRSITGIAIDDGVVYIALDDGSVAYFREERARPGTGVDGLGRGQWIVLPPVPGTEAYVATDPKEILRARGYDAGEDL